MLALVAADTPAHFDVALSAIFLIALAGGLLAFWIEARVRAAQAKALAKKAAAATDREAPLAPGPAIVAGNVALANGEDVAMRVDVDQEGSEGESSGTWTTTWTETDRKVTMRPFYLVQKSGERVRVEPRDRAFLVDAMDGMILVDRMHRTRFAELSPDEHVFAVGRLSERHDPEKHAAGYREAPKGWVLRPNGREDLLLSSEPLEKRYLRRARTHRAVAFVTVLLAALAGAIFSPYLARIAAGSTVEATVTEKRLVESTDDDGHRRVDHVLDLRVPDGTRLTLDVNDMQFASIEADNTVLVRYVPSWRFASALGKGPTTHIGIMFALGLLGVMAGLRLAIQRAGLVWYEKRVVDSVNGRLDENGKKTSM